MSSRILRFVEENDGQDLIEYGLLASLIALTAMTGVLALGSGIATMWNSLAGGVSVLP